MNFQDSQSEKAVKTTPEIVYECNCKKQKKFRVVYDGGFDEKFTVEYCQKCYDQDNKQFMISMERVQ